VGTPRKTGEALHLIPGRKQILKNGAKGTLRPQKNDGFTLRRGRKGPCQANLNSEKKNKKKKISKGVQRSKPPYQKRKDFNAKSSGVI